MKPPNCMAKEFFAIKESPIRNSTKMIKQILDATDKKFDLKSKIMSINYLQTKKMNSLLE